MTKELLVDLAGSLLTAEYVFAAFVRGLAGWYRRSLRRAYWVSALSCLALAAHQVWWLMSNVPVNNRIMFYLGSAMALGLSAIIQPPLVVLREQRRGTIRLPVTDAE